MDQHCAVELLCREAIDWYWVQSVRYSSAPELQAPLELDEIRKNQEQHALPKGPMEPLSLLLYPDQV